MAQKSLLAAGWAASCLLTTTLGFGLAVLTKPIKLAPPVPTPPLDLSSAQDVITRLKPLTKGGNTDVSVILWADHSVNIRLRFDKCYYDCGTDYTIGGSGPDLASAIHDLASKSESISKALAP